ncbi:BQ2448_3119 [Microbotryum intermedium]|uniref:BQ2448_3119 protein n=1 Tax=Microbotryum intermedium TaxID=269621 RepID=A0A238FHC9_9BASI|nr:BQ2448_3119 [Microbotryum intermedium]
MIRNSHLRIVIVSFATALVLLTLFNSFLFGDHNGSFLPSSLSSRAGTAIRRNVIVFDTSGPPELQNDNDASITERKLVAGEMNRTSPHTFAVCAMILDEAPFLEEWIVYHAAMGVEHFYLYDQGNDTETIDVIAPMADRGLVTLHRVLNQSREFMFQTLLLRKCFDDYGATSEWLAHFDIDEFLVHKPEPYEKPAAELGWPKETILRRMFNQEPFRTAAGVHVSRHNFINLAIETLTADQLVVQSHLYRRRLPSLARGDNNESVEAYLFTKSFAHSGYSSTSVAIIDSHRMEVRAPLDSQPQLAPPSEMYFNPVGDPVEALPNGRYDGKMVTDYTRLYLNHYMSRSRDECAQKARRRQECCPLSWRAKVGESWCDSTSFYVPKGSWNQPGQRWILDTLRFDPFAAQSFFGVMSERILKHWREEGIGHAWIRTADEWEQVSKRAMEKLVVIE